MKNANTTRPTQYDDITVAKARLSTTWSTHGWDHDDKLALAWLEDIEDQYHGQIQLAIDKVFHDLIEQLERDPEVPTDLENGPSERDLYDVENRAEDIEFLTVELARLINMRNELLK